MRIRFLPVLEYGLREFLERALEEYAYDALQRWEGIVFGKEEVLVWTTPNYHFFCLRGKTCAVFLFPKVDCVNQSDPNPTDTLANILLLIRKHQGRYAIG